MRYLIAPIIIVLLSFSGCAINYTDKQGFDHHVGFYSIKTEPNKCVITNTVKSVGLTVDSTKDSGGINIGYRVLSKAYISNNLSVEVVTDNKGNIQLNEISEPLGDLEKRCIVPTIQKPKN